MKWLKIDLTIDDVAAGKYGDYITRTHQFIIGNQLFQKIIAFRTDFNIKTGISIYVCAENKEYIELIEKEFLAKASLKPTEPDMGLLIGSQKDWNMIR